MKIDYCLSSIGGIYLNTQMNKNIYFEQIYREMYEEIKKFIAYYIGNDRRVLDDIIQDTFIETFVHIDKLFQNENYRGWVYNTAKYKIMKYRSNLCRTDSKCVGLEYVDYYWEARDLVQQRAIFLDLSEVLTEWEYRLVIQHYKYGYTYEEIAKENNMRLGACKMRMHRIIKKLRSAM